MSYNLFMINTAVSVAVVVVVLLLTGFVYTRLHRRTTSGTAVDSRGAGEQKVTVSHSAIAPPVLNEKTALTGPDMLRLEVARRQGQSLITLDRKRVDLAAAFLMRVRQTAEVVSTATRALGPETMDSTQLKILFEDRFVDALRTTAATTTMKGLLRNRSGFARAVQEAAARSVERNGLELESVLLISVEQTAEDFNRDTASGIEAQVHAQRPAAHHPQPHSSNQKENAMFEQQKTNSAARAAQDPPVVKTEAERQRESEHETGIVPAERHQAWEKAGIATSKTSLAEPAGAEGGGIAAVHDAKNRMGAAQIDLAVRMQLIQSLPGIVTQALTPAMGPDGSIRLAQQHQVVKSIVDAIMKDAGLGNPSLCDIVQILEQVVVPARAKGGAG